MKTINFFSMNKERREYSLQKLNSSKTKGSFGKFNDGGKLQYELDKKKKERFKKKAKRKTRKT